MMDLIIQCFTDVFNILTRTCKRSLADRVDMLEQGYFNDEHLRPD